MYALFLSSFDLVAAKPILVVLFCFVAGYFVVNQVWTGIAAGRTKEGSDDHCRHVLGLGTETDADAIYTAYQSRLKKYDPGKFAEYGPEFQELAMERTKAIVAAYQRLITKANR